MIVGSLPGISTAQSSSNEGDEFYAVFPTHVPSQNRLADYSLFVTSREASSGKIQVGSYTRPFSVQANTVTEIPIPRYAAYIDESEAGQVLNRGIHITVDPGQPKIVVYGHIFAGARSAASLILPVEAMGQQYFSMNYYNFPNRDGGSNYLIVVATEPDTRIRIRKGGSDLVSGGVLLNKAGDVYELTSYNDLTGTEVVVDSTTSSCKRFALFSGHTNVLIGSCAGEPSSDPLYQQNYPVESWGSTYGFIPFSDKSSGGLNARIFGDYYRVLARENGTEVRVNGNLVGTLNSGNFYEPNQPSNVPLFITSSKPVAVAQYSLTQSCAGGGLSDPDMVILNPIEYNIKDITVYSSRRENIEEQYLNVLIKTAAAASFKINGAPPTAGFTPVAANPAYSYLKLNLNRYGTNNFNLTADDGFNAIAYGFGTFESYAYSAGTNLASIQSITAIRPNTEIELTNACTREDFNFKLILPDEAAELTWRFDENDPGVVQTNPRALPITRGDRILYQYLFPKTKVFETPGKRTIRIAAKYLDANQCNQGGQELSFDFDVYDPPVVAFEQPLATCPNTPIDFIDKTVSNGKPILGWLWDFGDGEVSTDQNPKHSFKISGDYQVKLIVDNGTGCSGDPAIRTAHIKDPPKAMFMAADGTCTSNTVTFSDQSTTPEGAITSWIWDLGDTILTRNSGEPFQHTYSQIGTYNAQLSIVNSTGCQSDLYGQQVKVFAPQLKAGGILYILKGGQKTFDITAEGNNLVYRWSPATGLDRTDIKNPTASPTEDVTYTVTITTAEGCTLSDQIVVKVLPDVIIPNTFTPNGDNVNDVWTINYLDSYPGVTVNIYNRYGMQVFSSTGYSQPWDGKKNSEQVPVGTYYYVINPRNGKNTLSGWVMVAR
ncbi:PKD domain-containing protein [Pedobacter sp. HMF7647]|uniref:PKD domain-containing protein n=2 Tax=Hufsiella arboris TaxID=2695275 RepID=A0A7K1YFB4_9SPHI|nr:PKD domain-containing protein [Hufsiella arboris]